MATNLREELHQLSASEAAFYARLGLQLGVATLADVSEWVDDVLLQEPEPELFYLELYRYLRTGKDEVLAYLSLAFPPESFSVRPALAWLQQHLSAGSWSLGQTISALYRLRLLVTSDREIGWIYGLAADYEHSSQESAEALRDVYRETEAFLACYHDYTFANRAEWLYLDAALEQRLANLHS
ncbi:hypothetical protein [Hymenobacter sp. AT01-02]|uniref:hypothetical protein n=1 Tax=Hymenobacter sp. AT01-02 TaxID=1571877 RepID=UPI0005F16059|nr:hypothetical protein [Hymenobacter sp. AT01-02]